MGDSRGPYTDTDDLHVSVRTISTHYHNIKQYSHGRSPRAQIYNLNISPSPARTIFTCPTYTQSHLYACAQYCFDRGNDDASQSINMNIIRNHLNYHNYTGEINKTQSHKEFKSIIYQLMPICFGILKFQSTFYNRNFSFL